MVNFLGAAFQGRQLCFLKNAHKKINFMNTLFILLLYHFFQECPSGVVNEETFKEIYSQFFPQGGEYE